MDIQIRLYDEGLAMCYYFQNNPTGIYYKITEENTEFTFPDNTMAWFEPWAQGPLTLQLENGLYACLAEANMVDYARRKDTTWWIGVLNGATEREVKIPLDFLIKSTNAILIYDDKQNNSSIDRREQMVSPKDVLTIKLVSGGGFVARL